jgi:hypothetical protein
MSGSIIICQWGREPGERLVTVLNESARRI